MLLVARLMIAAASERRESRGVHYRRDFPRPEPGLLRHIALDGAPTAGVENREAGTEPLKSLR